MIGVVNKGKVFELIPFSLSGVSPDSTTFCHYCALEDNMEACRDGRISCLKFNCGHAVYKEVKQDGNS